MAVEHLSFDRSLQTAAYLKKSWKEYLSWKSCQEKVVKEKCTKLNTLRNRHRWWLTWSFVTATTCTCGPFVDLLFSLIGRFFTSFQNSARRWPWPADRDWCWDNWRLPTYHDVWRSLRNKICRRDVIGFTGGRFRHWRGVKRWGLLSGRWCRTRDGTLYVNIKITHLRPVYN